MLVMITPQTIDEVFENAQKQSDYLLKLYRMAIPDFDEMEKYDGHPEVSKKTSEYLFTKAIQFDKNVHPDVFGGGLWMSMGFSAANDVPDWYVRIDKAAIVYGEE